MQGTHGPKIPVYESILEKICSGCTEFDTQCIQDALGESAGKHGAYDENDKQRKGQVGNLWEWASVSENGRFLNPPIATMMQTEKLPQIVSCAVLINQRLVIFALVDFLRKIVMIFGYARVSTSDQQLHLQTDALQTYGCVEVTQEKVSSVKVRPALQHLLTRLRPGDTLVVWKLDRLGRSLKDLVTLVSGFQQQGVHFVSLQDHLDTTTAQGRLMFNLFASLAEFERDIIRERTKAGLTAARARGRQGGRPKGLSKEALSKAQAAKTLYLQQDKTVAEIAQLLGVGRATIYRYLAYLEIPTGRVS